MNLKVVRVWMLCCLLWATGFCGTPDPNDFWLSVDGGMGLGASSEEAVRASVLYWPDYNADGAIGITVIGGDMLPEDEFAWGPTAEFCVGPVSNQALRAILPDAWAAAFGDMTADVKPYGVVSILFDEDFSVGGAAGTCLRIFPNARIQPTLRTEYFISPSNSHMVGLKGWLTTFSVGYFF